MHDFLALFSNSFLRMALGAGLLSSVVSGIIGSYIVVKRIVFISGSIAHAVLGGMGLALYLSRTYGLPQLQPIHGAVISAIIAALLIGWIHLKYKEREDTVIAAIWATGMSIGVIFISLTPGYSVELIHFLFGNILWTSSADILVLLGLDIAVLVVTLFFHNRFLAICFDEEQAKLQKQPVVLFYFLLLSLVALTVVLLVQVVGAILVIAILTLPAAIANTYTKKLANMMCLAILIGGFITFTGILSSFLLNWPPGATITLAAASLYLINLLKGDLKTSSLINR